jgi:hypothetical protein
MPPTDAPSSARNDIARPWFATGWFLVFTLVALWQVGAGMKPSSLPGRD